MSDFSIVDAAEKPYLYVDRTINFDQVEHSLIVAFDEVWSFMEEHGVASSGPPLSYFFGRPTDMARFRAGFLIDRSDMAAAKGTVKATTTPACRVIKFTHHGAYDALPGIYDSLFDDKKVDGLTTDAPSWQIYVNDPSEVREEQLRTDCYQALDPKAI